MRPRYVIIGGGLAAAAAARALRSEGFDGDVVLVSAEPYLPYERPPLSKGYLTGAEGAGALTVRPQEWYDENDIELVLGTAAEVIDPAERSVELAGGRTLRFDKLVLATGSEPRRLPVPGADLEGVHHLRDVGDSDRLRALLSAGELRVVVVGGGWIGLETAAAARGFGNQVTVLEQSSTVLEPVLGPELGDVFARLHRDHGVDVRAATSARELRGEGGRVGEVRTDSGDVLPADLVIVGVGARPRIELAKAAGLDCAHGVVTDAALRSSHPDIHIAGDIAEWPSGLLGRSIRVEHWDNAKRSGRAAARAALGQDVSYDPVPYFYSDQYDLGMEYVGMALPGQYDQVVYRGDVEAREFISFWLSESRVVAAMNVNIWDVSKPLKEIVRRHHSVDVRAVADPDVPLESLLESGSEVSAT